MTPTAAYKLLNKTLWLNRLPRARVILVDDGTIPKCYGLTIHDDICVKPIILINAEFPNWGRTLVHECLHVAEPSLSHGPLFEALVNRYWRLLKIKFKDLR